MSNFSYYDQTKLDLIKSFPFQKKISAVVSIALNGIVIRFQLQSEYISERYLRCYYKEFLCENSREADCIVNLYSFDNEYASIGHDIWNERWPRFHFINLEEENKAYIIEREYIAQSSNQLREIDCLVPEINEINPDSLDNLVSTIFSSFMKKSKSLILHSAGVVKDGKAYIFFGHSGVGKSTLADLCHKKFGLKIIGSDQVYLRLIEGKLYAQATSITIPEIKRDDPKMFWKPLEVAGLINLSREGEDGFFLKKPSEILANFMKETLIYLTPVTSQEDYMNLLGQIFSIENIIFGQLKYKKDDNFWDYLK
ncbi:hypothetical protein [Bacteriovorax sp. DB6_IX]|uniref:hypothetical protein n=1 Tax=Bacteriovorax sp. DB6_IX TaxID=1353530 RepID=UPI000389ED10|nr:hypothetical protein [Bacteriovorax sp. DB6_IX]EQC51389.1 hypothetical protein M901_2444 [Bacteriovorax sp. DB6_IX]